jgi:hypothetical protein
MLLQGHWNSLWYCFLNQLTILQSYLLLDVMVMIMSLIFFSRRKQIADIAGLDEELDGYLVMVKLSDRSNHTS